MRNATELPKYEPQGRDGSYQWSKKDQEKREKELRTKFEQRLKSAKDTLKSRPVSITEAKGNLYLQFSTQIQYDGSMGATIRSKYSVAQYLGISRCADTPEAVNSALEVALRVAKELESGTFTWDNYVCWIKGELPEHLKQKAARAKTCKELIEEFEAHYRATHDYSTEEKVHKSEKTWTTNYLPTYKKLPQEQKLDLSAIKETLGHYNPNKTTYNKALIYLGKLIEFHSIAIDLKQFQLKGEKQGRVGKDLPHEEITEGWKRIKHSKAIQGTGSKYRDLFAWMYGMMATYGLRNHEVLNIQNLTQPFKVPNENIILPAFNDPNNKEKVIYTHGKTGERTQPMPLPIEWIELFELENVPEFPIFETLKQKDRLVSSFTRYCRGEKGLNIPRKIDFVPYDLRHSYAMRCRKTGINPLDAKDIMGHSLEMHEKVYNKGNKTSNLIRSAQKYQQLAQEKPELSEVELLRLENQQLKEQVKELTEQVKLLLEKLSSR